MRRFFVILLCLSMILPLSGCIGLSPIMYDNSGSMADNHFEQLLNAIGQKDADAVNKLFSEKAKAEAEDLEANIEALFEFVQGEVISWEDDGLISGGAYEYGKSAKYVYSWYKVTTTTDTYLFFMYDYYKDTLDPNNDGLYSLRVIKAQDEDIYFTFAERMHIPGIYIPPEYFNTEIE